MDLTRHNYTWNGKLTKRRITDLVVIHHTASASDLTVEDIHRMHVGNGWVGIGYNVVIYPDGSIHEGRPLDCSGAHCEGENSHSVGVNLVGNFELYPPTPEQIESLKEVIKYLREQYGDVEISGHYEYNATACPGANLKVLLPEIISA